MAISDHDLVVAAAATYDPAAIPLYEGIGGAVRVFLSKVNGLNVVAIEGTKNAPGWALDFVAIPEEDRPKTDHPSLDWVHAGFMTGATLAIDSVRRVAQQAPYAITGHSLGAALAELIGALLSLEGLPPVKIGSFAPPRVGGDKFLSVLMSLPVTAYRYADDPIPLVPFFLPGFPYRQVPLIQIGRGSFARAILDPFVYHHCQNYLSGVPQEEA